MNYAKLKKVQDNAVAQAGEVLGHFCWWSLNGAMIDHAALVAKARAAGLDEKYLPKPIKAVAAFRRGWRHAARRCPSGLLLREIGETPDRIEVALVKEQADVTQVRLDYDIVSHITFDKGNETITVRNANDVTDEILRLDQQHHAHGSDDLRAMLVSLMKEAGVSIRDGGGVYFVGPSYASTLSAMSAVIDGIGHNKIFSLPIADVGDAKNTLTAVAKETLDDEIRALEAELDAFAESTAETRADTLARRLERFDQLRSRVALFSGCLSFKADALVEKIGSMQEDLRGKLNGRVLENAVTAAPKGEVALRDVVGF
jgi:hypothetical protein